MKSLVGFLVSVDGSNVFVLRKDHFLRKFSSAGLLLARWNVLVLTQWNGDVTSGHNGCLKGSADEVLAGFEDEACKFGSTTGIGCFFV
jgi:hypothetical protein